MSGFETSGEFISIGKGTIASEAIAQQLEADPSVSLAFVQGSQGLYEPVDLDALRRDGKLQESLAGIENGVNPGLAIVLSDEEPPTSLLDLTSEQADEVLRGVEFALEATPYGAHEEMARIIPELSARGIFTVMASKGFMAEHPAEAMEVFLAGYLGRDATLGGDTGVFPHFDEIADDRIVSFEGVFNGTYSRMMDLIRAGKRPKEVLEIVGPDNEALAEPGAKNLLEVLHGEHGDNVGKAVNAYNFGLLPNLSRQIHAEDFARIEDADISDITEEQAQDIFEDPYRIAYVVNWHRDGSKIPPEYYDPNKSIGVFTLPVSAGGLIIGSFRRLDKSSPMHGITQNPGPLNGIALYKQVGPGQTGIIPYARFGIGAGPVPTAHRMVLNAANMRARHNMFRFIG